MEAGRANGGNISQRPNQSDGHLFNDDGYRAI